MRTLLAPQALLPEGWRNDALIDIAADGTIAAVRDGGPPAGAERLAGPVIPGMPSLHSHAFQRAMAGRTERLGGSDDSFWTWRDLMYRFVARLTPELCGAIALQLYIEMLKRGYTAVGEFHYLHNDPAGKPYAEPAELSFAVVRAARDAGIAITHLPVLYAQGGFGGEPLGTAQQRFAATPRLVVDIAAKVRERYAADADLRVGVAPHSLRAVSPDLLAELLAGVDGLDPLAPIHIHAAEQVGEVDACLAWSGKRPVQWLLEHVPLGPRWCVVHATHMTASETAGLASSGAVAGLCPTTEANLGDGLFPIPDYLAQGGRFGVGGDSHVCRDPAEELRWLEYGQRLALRRRNVAATAVQPSVAATLWRAAAAGGSQALARSAGAIAPGKRADLLVLDGEHVGVAEQQGDAVLDALVFGGSSGLVRDVMVGGTWVVQDRRHARERDAARHFRAAVRRLTD